MILVPSIKRGVDWAGVKNQRHVRGGCRSEASLTAVREEPDSPTPMLCGFGRYVAALTSSASRITVARETLRETASLRSRSMTSSSATIVVRSIHHYVPRYDSQPTCESAVHLRFRPWWGPNPFCARPTCTAQAVRTPLIPPDSDSHVVEHVRSLVVERHDRGRPRTESDSCRDAIDRARGRLAQGNSARSREGDSRRQCVVTGSYLRAAANFSATNLACANGEWVSAISRAARASFMASSGSWESRLRASARAAGSSGPTNKAL